MLRQLEVSHQFPVAEDRTAEPSAECDDELEPLPHDDAESVHLRVVEDANGPLQGPGEGLCQVEGAFV